jgi:uncharacterized protein YbaA (DUF1428 family)
MSYIDGFVMPVPKDKKGAYREMASEAQPLFKEYGALRIVECWGDDVPKGEITDFYRSVQATSDETIVFSWIVWPSKEVRDRANEKMRDDPRMQPKPDQPFDMKRLIYGGFSVLIDSDGKL